MLEAIAVGVMFVQYHALEIALACDALATRIWIKLYG